MIIDKIILFFQFLYFINLFYVNGKLVERQGRKAKGPKDLVNLWQPVA